MKFLKFCSKFLAPNSNLNLGANSFDNYWDSAIFSLF